jgi:hypothetical protein
VARAGDAVALKARAAAVSETYATQGLRSAAILPFTSALGGLCAAASAAAVELLPFVHEKPLQALVAFFFPAAGGFFAAAASVSKSRCEVDAAAAKAASEAFAEAGLTAKDRSEKGALQPFRYVGTLIGLAVRLFIESRMFCVHLQNTILRTLVHARVRALSLSGFHVVVKAFFLDFCALCQCLLQQQILILLHTLFFCVRSSDQR